MQNKQNKYVFFHMKAAYLYANLSYCKRRKVGCIIVKDDRVLSIGYNGSPHGWQNVCEDETGLTLPEIYHAETNALSKLTASNDSSAGASLFITTAPCLNCAKLIVQSKIKSVYYGEVYHNDDGIQFLKKCGIKVFCADLKNQNTLQEYIAEKIKIKEL